METPDPDTMRALLRNFRQLDPDAYCDLCHRILPLDAQPSDALSDRQLEIISGIIVKTRKAAAESRPRQPVPRP
jgi:hypothetical protein